MQLDSQLFSSLNLPVKASFFGVGKAGYSDCRLMIHNGKVPDLFINELKRHLAILGLSVADPVWVAKHAQNQRIFRGDSRECSILHREKELLIVTTENLNLSMYGEIDVARGFDILTHNIEKGKKTPVLVSHTADCTTAVGAKIDESFVSSQHSGMLGIVEGCIEEFFSQFKSQLLQTAFFFPPSLSVVACPADHLQGRLLEQFKDKSILGANLPFFEEISDGIKENSTMPSELMLSEQDIRDALKIQVDEHRKYLFFFLNIYIYRLFKYYRGNIDMGTFNNFEFSKIITILSEEYHSRRRADRLGFKDDQGVLRYRNGQIYTNNRFFVYPK